MKIKLDHINLTVSSLEESITWYKNVFGFQLVEQGTSPYNRRWAIVSFDDSMICMTEFKDRKNADIDDNNQLHKLYHFGIRVSDEETWRNKIKAQNLKFSYGEFKYPSSTSWYVLDPNGHEIEVSYTKDEYLKFPDLS